MGGSRPDMSSYASTYFTSSRCEFHKKDISRRILHHCLLISWIGGGPARRGTQFSANQIDALCYALKFYWITRLRSHGSSSRKLPGFANQFWVYEMISKWVCFCHDAEVDWDHGGGQGSRDEAQGCTGVGGPRDVRSRRDQGPHPGDGLSHHRRPAQSHCRGEPPRSPSSLLLDLHDKIVVNKARFHSLIVSDQFISGTARRTIW